MEKARGKLLMAEASGQKNKAESSKAASASQSSRHRASCADIPSPGIDGRIRAALPHPWLKCRYCLSYSQMESMQAAEKASKPEN